MEDAKKPGHALGGNNLKRPGSTTSVGSLPDVSHRAQVASKQLLARQAPTPEQIEELFVRGYDGPVISRLHAIELIDYIARRGAV